MSRFAFLDKLLNKKTTFSRDRGGKITTNNLPTSWNKVYAQSVVKYLNCLEPLFDKAQEQYRFS